MEEITLSMNEDSCEGKRVDDSWITAFGESIGIRIEEADKLAQDAQKDRIAAQNRLGLRCKYCNKPISVEQESLYVRQSGRCKECAAEALISLEDADEVISSCLCVLDVVYGIKIGPSVSVRLSHRRKKELVRIKSPGLGERLKQLLPFTKTVEKKRGQKTISIRYGVSRVRVIESYLEECFQEALQHMNKGGTGGKEKDAVSDSPSSSSTGKKTEENIGKEGRFYENTKERYKTENDVKEAERPEEDKVKEDAGKEKKLAETYDFNALRAWLVANCLYTMGELSYAQQYIADYQEQSGGKYLDGINSKIGIPWNVMGMGLGEIVKKLLIHNHIY